MGVGWGGGGGVLSKEYLMSAGKGGGGDSPKNIRGGVFSPQII